MKLNAPPGYRWTDADVIFEKRDSWYSGVEVGILIGVLLSLLVLVVVQTL